MNRRGPPGGLFPKSPGSGGRWRERLQERLADLADVSDGADQRPEDRAAWPIGATLSADLPYGVHPEQRLDVVRPAQAAKAPLLLMVHGGGWQIGDKSNPRVMANKVTRWVGQGYALVSINYRLLPEASPVEQADDVAEALAFVQRTAPAWGADPERLLLMGHSAGAHLVALLTADPDISRRHGVRPWCGTVALDSAAFDVVQIMGRPHLGLYDTAFGDDPAYWQQASPVHRLAGQPQAPLLAVCSSHRPDACAQAQAFAAKAISLGGRATVLPVDLGHREINERLGLDGDYTDQVEAFMRSVGLP